MFRIALKSIFARKRRLILTSLVIVVGVAFISGTAVLSNVLQDSADSLVQDIFRGIDVNVRSSETSQDPFDPEPVRPGIPLELGETIAAVEGVERVEPSITVLIKMLDKDDKPIGGLGPPSIAINWTERVGGATMVEGRGRPPAAPDEAVLDFKTAADKGFDVGDTITIQTTSGGHQLELVGIAGLGENADRSTGAQVLMVTFDRASEFAGYDGEVDSFEVAGDGSMSQEELAAAVGQALPSNTEAITGDQLIEEQQEEIGDVIGIITSLIGVFGYLAAFVAAFVIYNVFSITIAQRTREIALFRAIGASRRQMLASVMAEATAMGIVAAILGVGAGYLLALLMKQAAAGLFTLGDGAPSLTVSAVTTSLVVGLATTVLSAIIPARRATRIAPLAALGESAIETSHISIYRRVVGPIMLFGGIGLIVAGTQGWLPNALAGVGIGGALLFTSLVVVGPIFAKPIAKFIGAPAPALAGTTGTIAQENAARNPKRTTSTGVALTIGVSLVTLLAVVAASFTNSFRDAFENQLDADIIVDAAGGGFTAPAYVGFDLVDLIEDIDGVAVSSPVGFTGGEVINSVKGQEVIAEATPEEPRNGEPVMILGVEPAEFFRTNDLGEVQGTPDDLDPGSVALRIEELEANDWEVGDSIEMYFASVGNREFTIAGAYDTAAFGPQPVPEYLMGLTDYEEVAAPAQRGAVNVFVLLDEGVETGPVIAQIETLFEEAAPAALVQDIGTFIEEQTALFSGLLNLIYPLLFLAVFVAIVGIAITMSLSVFERTREFGLLRAVGMERPQVRRAVRIEAAIISFFGTVIGVIAGTGLAAALVSAMSDDGITLTLPFGQLLFILVIGAFAGVIAALFPARRASKLDILEALATT